MDAFVWAALARAEGWLQANSYGVRRAVDDRRRGTGFPGTVRGALTGLAPDLIKVILFLDRVTAGDSPASVLAVLHLAAIRITSETGRGSRVNLTLELEEAGR